MPNVDGTQNPARPIYAVWPLEGVLGELALKRLAFVLVVPLPVAVTCLVLGYNAVGLGVLLLAVLPTPFRCRVDAAGLRISWLFIRHFIPWTCVRSVHLHRDARHWIIVPPRRVLVLCRHGRLPLTLCGDPDLLADLALDVARFFPTRYRPLV